MQNLALPLVVLASLACPGLAQGQLSATEGGVRLTQPEHEVAFDSDGVLVQPERGPEWRWRLEHFGSEARSILATDALAGRSPEIERADRLTFDRGSVQEQYLVHPNGMEQRFVIPAELELGGADLVIAGSVACEGQLSETADGWKWSDGKGAVTLGRVFVFDATGDPIAAEMMVEPDRTLIRVDGAELETAAYPVTVDPEIGTDDFAISQTLPLPNPDVEALDPAVAYSAEHDTYLVVWSANGGTFGPNQSGIYGRLYDANTRLPLGGQFSISQTVGAVLPDVACGNQGDEFFVVWEQPGQIKGRRIHAGTGGLLSSEAGLASTLR